LFLEGLRHLRPAGGHDDGIIGGMVRPSTCAVAMEDVNIVVAEFGQGLGGGMAVIVAGADRDERHLGRDSSQQGATEAGCAAVMRHSQDGGGEG